MDKEIKEILMRHEEDIKELKEIAKESNKLLKDHDKRIRKLEEIEQENKKTFERIDKTFERIDKKLDEHDKILESLQRSMVIIEDAVVNKIPALFDGYTMHQEKQEQLEARMNKLEDVSQMHSIRIMALEDKSNPKTVKLSS